MSPRIRYRRLSFLGFPTYRIGDDGTVWSYRLGWIQLKPKILTKKPYRRIRLCNGREQKLFLIHRLVLLAFVGPCPDGCECRHLDGDPTNNHLDNLCWGTLQENWEDRRRHGVAPQGERSGNAKLTDEQVRWLKHEYRSHGDGFPSQRAFARHYAGILDVSPVTVRSILRGIWWRHIS